MSIREVTQAATADASRTQRMVRILITEGRVYAVWRVELPSGKRDELSIPVTDDLETLIENRVSFQNFIDNVRDNTIGRTGA